MNNLNATNDYILYYLTSFLCKKKDTDIVTDFLPLTFSLPIENRGQESLSSMPLNKPIWMVADPLNSLLPEGEQAIVEEAHSADIP